MKDVVLPLRTGFYNLLNDIVVDSQTVKFYDMQAPHNAQVPYIVIGGIVPISNNTKDEFCYDVTTDLFIYTTTPGDFGGRKKGDIIANAVLELVIPSPSISGVSAEGFNVCMAKQVAQSDEFENSDTKRIYRKRVTIEMTAWQLS